jgi:hypothetical protein
MLSENRINLSAPKLEFKPKVELKNPDGMSPRSPEVKFQPSVEITVSKSIQYREPVLARFYREQYKETYEVLGISELIEKVVEESQEPTSPPPSPIFMRKQDSFSYKKG